MNAGLTASRELVDPRVAATGGTRTSAKANYDWPGMMEESSWRRTPVHHATSMYGCSRCGTKFTGPHAVYTHLAKRHGR